MNAPRRDRLEAYLATLRSPSLKEAALKDAAKRRVAHWQLYAAMTGSAVALAVPMPLAAQQPSDTSQSAPLIRSVRLAGTRRSASPSIEDAALAMVAVSPSSAPTIGAGGVVPLYGSTNVI